MKADILIVDDHPLFRRGLATLLGQEAWCSRIDEAGDLDEARQHCEQKLPDLMILDLSLGERNALGFVKDLKLLWAGLQILVVSMHAEEIYAQRVIKAGARGYVMKSEPPDRIVAAVRTVLTGRLYLSRPLQERLLERSAGPSLFKSLADIEVLTDRELEVLRLVGRGFGTQEIAGMLNLSVKTVDTHREHIKVKLQLGNAQELRRFAMGVAER